MKKFLLTFAAVILAAVAVNAQPRAIGGRLGYGVEFSYQHSVSPSNMVQAELSFPGFVEGVGQQPLMTGFSRLDHGIIRAPGIGILELVPDSDSVGLT